MKKLLLISLLISASVAPVSAFDGGWVLTTDYGTFGSVRSFGPDAPWTVSSDLAPIPGDPAARWFEGNFYVLGRAGSNVLQVYGTTGGLALEREFSLGAGRNPQDIAFDSAGEAYVSCYDQAVLLRVDVESETILQTYDTSFLADADGLPETSWMIAVGDRLFISVQKLDQNNWYTPTGPGEIAVFDMATEQWVDTDPVTVGVQAIPLIGTNPYTRIEPVRDGLGNLMLRIGCTGNFVATDGGIEQIDPDLLTNEGQMVTEAELGGDIIGMLTTGATLHVLISDTSFGTSLRRFDPGTGLVTVLDASVNYDHADIAWDGGFQLYLADRAEANSGLRVFDAVSGSELTTSVIPTGLAPFMFVLKGTVGISPVPGASPAKVLSMEAPVPNPCNPRATVRITGRPGEKARVRVIDLRGRAVASTHAVLDSRGESSFTFQGRDDGGRSLPAGVYRLVVQTGDGFAARSLTLVK
jgi:hypothetical protein